MIIAVMLYGTVGMVGEKQKSLSKRYLVAKLLINLKCNFPYKTHNIDGNYEKSRKFVEVNAF